MVQEQARQALASPNQLAEFLRGMDQSVQPVMPFVTY